MAAELEQEPDLNKAPPHLEGYLLKQRQSSVLKKGWKKYFFIVIEDHLKYYRKKEDYEAGKETISLMRLSQVKDITEAVFDAVPKKHHLNCGFSLVAFHEKSQHEQTFNLLAETAEVKRYWVRGLRYIQSYWSKRKIRETIMSEEKERELLERILREDEDDREVLWEESWAADGEDASNKSVFLTVYLGRGSKVVTRVSPLDTTSDLLESVKDQLTSSSSLLWLVDQSGADTILAPHDHPAAFLDKAHKFYALDPSQRVLVVFYGDGGFEAIAVSSNATAEEVVSDADIQIQLDKTGINNSGLFLKTDYDERLFGSFECPADVLFTLHSNGQVVKLDAGRLVVKNKALHGGKMTVKLPKVHRTMSHVSRTKSSERREMEEISEEEEAQAKALDLLLHKKHIRELPKTQNRDVSRPATVYDEDWIVMAPPEDVEPGPIPRARSTAISSSRHTSSPQNLRKRMSSTNSPSTISPQHSSPTTSPILSPSREGRGRCKSPRSLPTAPLSSTATDEGQGSSLQRRNASKKNRSGPTIHIDSEDTVVGGNMTTLVAPGNQHRSLSRTRSPTIRRNADDPAQENGGTVVDMFLTTAAGDSKVTPFQSLKPHLRKLAPDYHDDEDRLERLFDRSHQLETEERSVATATGRETEDSLHSKMVALSRGEREEEREEEREGEMEEEEERSEGMKPMVIDVSTLAPPHTTDGTTAEPQLTNGTKNRPPQVPMEVRSPNILKVILNASESTASDVGKRAMDLLSLSGVVVKNDRGVWHLIEGSNFHDPLPFDCSDHTERFVLPGGIRAIFNHSTTPKRWHVLPPPTPAPSVGSRSDLDETEHAQNIVIEDMDIGSPPLNSPQFYRKRLVTEVGAAAHEIVGHFENARHLEEKKRIGSDMINNSMGYTVRGKFCSALAGVILEGLRPYRIQRLFLNDIWKVTMAFCQEVQLSEASLFLPHEVDKLVQVMQAIGSLRALRDHNMKFRTFVCLCLSRGLLCKWLQMLPHLNDTLSKYYQSWALLVQATDQGWNQKLYNYMLQDLEPLNYLPFDLSIDFENKQELLAVCPEMRNYSRIPTPTCSPHPSPRPSPHSSPPHNSPLHSPLISPKFASSTTPPRRLSVTVVKNEATGQRTNNLITAVWQEEQEQDLAQEEGGERRDKEERGEREREERERGMREYTGVIEEPDVSFSKVTAELSQQQEEEEERGRREGEGRKLGRATSWLRKLATSFQEAAEAASEQPRPHPPPTTNPPSARCRCVQALYPNIAEDGDELSFSTGDIMTVTGQVNSEWLICRLEHRTGIVPANFVQDVNI